LIVDPNPAVERGGQHHLPVLRLAVAIVERSADVDGATVASDAVADHALFDREL
jgi:hypothetical protein